MTLPKELKACGDCSVAADLLAGNLELHIKVSALTDAIVNHRLNCQISTAVDSKLWEVLDEILDTVEK